MRKKQTPKELHLSKLKRLLKARDEVISAWQDAFGEHPFWTPPFGDSYEPPKDDDYSNQLRFKL